MSETGISALVVEDEPGARRLLLEILRTRGHTVEACADGETAWARFQKGRPELILLDLQLPGMGGMELCRKIRRTPDGEEAIILVVTGAEHRRSLEEALEAGADDYLQKPVNDERIHVRLAIAERRIHDLRERREMEDRLRTDALRDHLTGLANRTYLVERIEHAARRELREDRFHYAVLVVDLSCFSSVNRQFGREVGDEVLREVGRRLEECVRAIDTVARLTGDRFALLLDGLSDVSDPTRVAYRIHQSLSAPLTVGDGTIHLGACTGITLSASGPDGAEAMLRDAHSALDEAKGEGPGTYRIYDPVMHAKAMAQVELESRIRAAVEEGAMHLEFQPVVGLETGRVAGFEALLRWEDVDRGSVEPERFIPVAEGSGLIMTLGSWVLEQAVDQLAQWRAIREGSDDFFLSVNVSGKQLVNQPDLADWIKERLRRAQVPGSRLHVEVTETALMERAEVAERVLGSLRDESVNVQVDDFGTGYSSLSYLCRFPIDTLKVDRSFVNQMEHAPENLEVVRTIVHLARNLGMTVVAEGVETEGQLELLRKLGCDLAQGFLFARPVPAHEALEFLDRRLIG